MYHVLNRANGRLKLFKTEEDFIAFEQVLREAHERVPIRILDWCLMPNHWHFVLWPEEDGQLTQFMRWLTLTHAQRWKHALHPLLAKWPIDRPRRWLDRVNQPQAEDDAAVKLHIERSRPYGQPHWTQRMARMLGLEQSLRPRGRPVGWRKPAGSGGEIN